MPKLLCPKLSCKPKALHVGPLEEESRGSLPLLHEELEALYLADVKGLYHEACAISMDVSRPTFAKLLKSARRKCASMFLHGYALKLDLKPSTLRVVLPSDDRETLIDRFQSARYFVSLIWDESGVNIEEIIQNPIYAQLVASGIEPSSDSQVKGMGAGRLIPPLMKDVSMVCLLEIGEGMRRNLEGMGLGIQILPISSKGKTLKEIVKNLV